MSKWDTLTLHHVITEYNDMFDHMDGVMWALAMKKTQWKEDLHFAVRCARQALSKYYTHVTRTTGLLLIPSDIIDLFRKLRSFSKWDKGMDINADDEVSYTTQCQEGFPKYVENEYSTYHRWQSFDKTDRIASNNPFPRTDSGSGQSCYDSYNLSSDDDEYWTLKNVAEMTPGRSDHAVHSLSATRLYVNSPPEAPKTWGQIDPNRNDYHSDSIEISSILWLPEITDWWHQQEETHSKYADLSNMVHNILSFIPYGVGLVTHFPLVRNVIQWRQSKNTAETLPECGVVRQYTLGNNRLLAGNDPVLDTTEAENDI